MLDFPGKLAILTWMPEGPKPRAAWIMKTGKRNDSSSPPRAASPTPWEPPSPSRKGKSAQFDLKAAVSLNGKKETGFRWNFHITMKEKFQSE